MSTPGRHLYYGRVIVAIGFGTMLLVQGSFASSGVLFAALTKEYGWSRATISLPFSVALVWYLFAVVTGIGWLSNITNVHQIAHMVSNDFPSLLAAQMVAMMGLMRAAGSTIWGGLADRFGREGIYTVGTCLCLSGLACLATLTPSASVWLLYGYAVGLGLGFGVHDAVESTATADIFHGPHLGAILGVLELGWGLGGFLGAWFGGYWYDRRGSYHGAFALTMGVSLLGCLALWLAAPRHSRRAVSPPAPVS